MKLSEDTVEILKNFSTINSGLIFKPGNVLKTIAGNKTIVAEATVVEFFPQECAVYDLNKTLGILSMSKSAPEVSFDTECLTFSGIYGSKIRQRFAPVNMILGHDRIDKKINIDFKTTLNITPEIHKWILSVAHILGCPNIVIKCEDNGVNIHAMDVKGEIVDDACVNLTTNIDEDAVFPTVVLKIENIKIIPGGYEIAIADRAVRFKHLTKPIIYFISVEDNKGKK